MESYSSSEEEYLSLSSDEDEENGNKKRRSKKDKTNSYNNVPFDYNQVPVNHHVPLGKAPRFDGTYYTQWRHNMKMHLISVQLWDIVQTGVIIPGKKDDITPRQQQDLLRNAQATTLLLSTLEKQEFDRVDGLEVAKDVWDTLQRAHEGNKPMRKAKIQLLQGKLERFAMGENETPEEMYNRLKILVNKIRAYGSKKWGEKEVVDKVCRALNPRYNTLVTMIRRDPNYKTMTADDILGIIIDQERFDEDAEYMKSLSKLMSENNLDKKENIAFKASKKSKEKQVVEESSSEEESGNTSDDESDDLALFMRKLRRVVKKGQKHFGGKKERSRNSTKRSCYNCKEYGHFMANCPYDKKKVEDGKKKKEKSYPKNKKYYKKKHSGEAHIGQEWDSNEEESDSDDGVATIAVNNSSSSKALFPNLTKGKGVSHTCLMARETKKKVIPNDPSSPKYVSSDEEHAHASDNDDIFRGMNKRQLKELKCLWMSWLIRRSS